MGGAVKLSGQDEGGEYRPVIVGKDGYFGSSTGTYESGTSTITSTKGFAFIFAHSAASVDITSQDITGDALSAVPIPAGSTYRCGRATSITVNSGVITAYESV